MASMNMEEQLVDEQQPKEEKPINGKSKEPSENMDMNGVDLTKSAEEEMDKELETSTTTTVDLPRGHRIKLPPELEQQIFLCFNPATQRKFIYGLGWDFYAMFRYRLLIKTKRARNPHGNQWNNTNTRATISENGLNASNNTNRLPHVFAEQPFPISGLNCRADDFPGTILYYYEVKGDPCFVGLSDVAIPHYIGRNSNSYGIPILGRHCHRCLLAGELHRFELPEGAIEPERKDNGNVYGCGLVLDPDNKSAIFFTLNGQLLGRKITISPTLDRLFPSVKICDESSIEANFGDGPAKPFEYDIHNCPGLELTCI